MATINGTEGNDQLSGGADADSISGFGGNDFLAGNEGPDSIIGGAGNDTVFGDSGNDWLESGTGNDTLSGGSGMDSYVWREAGAANADLVTNFDSNWDKLQLDAAGFGAIGASGRFASGDVRFFAGAGATGGHDADDRIVYNTSTGQLFYDADGSGAGAAQLIATFQGAPTITAADINVFGTATPPPPPPPPPGAINGTSGNDTLTGTSGNDSINGFGGDDTLRGMDGSDTLDGGSGNDFLEGGNGADSLLGGDGSDVLMGMANDTTLAALPQPSDPHDTLDGGMGNDIYEVRTGDVIVPDPGGIDTVVGINSDWTLAGGLENLTLRQFQPVHVTGVGNELDNRLTAFDDGGVSLFGMGGNDSIDALNERGASDLHGGDGNDTLQGSFRSPTQVFGDAGNDTLYIAANNTLTGGSGADAFIFSSASLPATITDFASSVDKLRFDGFAFNQIGTSGNFAAADARFFAAPGAASGHDADDRLVYDTSTGNLYYDADGSGTGSALLVATLQGAPALAATDIAVDNGTDPNQVVNGTAGNDSLRGGSGNDTISGLDGNDTIIGNGGADSMIGGAGNDSLAGGFADIFFGHEPGDHFVGGDGDDTLDGFASRGSTDADTMDGGLGNDLYRVDNPVDLLTDAGGIDTVHVKDMDWTLASGFENLILDDNVSESRHTGTGNELDNVMQIGWTGRLFGMGGNDTLSGSFKTSELFGGDGNDLLIGGTLMDGGAGSDTLMASGAMTGGADADHFIFNGSFAFDSSISDFQTGVDKIHVDALAMPALGATGNFAAGDARFYAAPGATGGHDADDRIVYDTTSGRLYFDADGNGAQTAQLLTTLAGAPTLAASDFFVENGAFGAGINGTDGNDILTGGAADDTINGGAGNDTLIGNGGNDTLAGGNGDDSLLGGTGNDALIGDVGSDTLNGGAGEDGLYGYDDTNADVFVFDVAPGLVNADHVYSFLSGVDKIHLDARAMTALGASGTLAANDARFYAAPGANAGHDADDRIIYNTTTGELLYDQDGSGSSAASLIATLQGAPALSVTDIVVDNGTSAPPPSGSIVGTEGNDSLSGTSGNDTIYGLGGNDFITGNGGADSIVGGAGNDSIFGNDGNDWTEGTTGNDTISGGSGQDSYVFRESGAANADLITNFDSNWDNIQLDAAGFGAIGASGRFASGDVRFFAGAGATGGQDADDRIVYNTSTGQLFYDADGSGAGTAQLIATFQGAPAITAADLNVFATATTPPPPPPSGSTISGTPGNDSLVGTSGNDTIDGGAGADSMVGGDGDDLYFVDNVGDVVVEAQNAGIDEVRSTVNYTLSAWVNNLTLLDGAFQGNGNEIENVITGNAAGNALYGMAGNDTLFGGGGNDNLIGGLGNDSMSGGTGDDGFSLNNPQFGDNASQGSDTVDGGDGSDLVAFSTEGVSTTAAVTVDLRAGTYSIADAAGTVSGLLFNIENVQGSASNDLIIGNDAGNRLDGFHGNDTLIGGGGNDVLIGDGYARNTADLDVMDGGAGNDTLDGSGTYRFSVAPGAANADRINSIDTNDTIQLDATVFANAGANGRLAAGDGRFYSAAGATGGHDADDRIVYDTSSGNLWYDADGSGAGTAQLIATLPVGAALAANQFEIINGSATPPPPPPPGTNDFISGTDGADTLIGGAGNDTIYGNAGNDWIESGAGNDTISGGSGQDSYVWREYGAANADSPTSFDTNWDMLRLDTSVFTGLGGTGRFSSGDARFYSAAGASGGHDADDRIVYNSSTGQLYYDADGSGAGGAELIATFTAGTTVVASDLFGI